MNWYKHYMGDYGRDTADLSMTQDGAYRRLLDRYYTSGGPLSADKSALYRITRAFERWEREAVDSVLAKFFQLTGEGYIQKRAERELAKYKKAADVHKANLGRKMDSQNGLEKPETRNQNKPKSKPLAASPPKRATQLPDAFHLTEDMQKFSVERMLDPIDQLSAFKDYHRSKGSLFKDWQAAWRTWCRNAVKFNSRGGSNGKQGSFSEAESQRDRDLRVAIHAGSGPEILHSPRTGS